MKTYQIDILELSENDELTGECLCTYSLEAENEAIACYLAKQKFRQSSHQSQSVLPKLHGKVEPKPKIQISENDTVLDIVTRARKAMNYIYTEKVIDDAVFSFGKISPSQWFAKLEQVLDITYV